MKAKKRQPGTGTPWPVYSARPLLPKQFCFPELKNKVIADEWPLNTKAKATAHLAQQEGLIRARRNGLSLVWLKGWEHLKLDEIHPTPAPRKPSTARAITLATDYPLKARKNSMGFNGLKVSLRESDPSPGWENGIRAMEGE